MACLDVSSSSSSSIILDSISSSVVFDCSVPLFSAMLNGLVVLIGSVKLFSEELLSSTILFLADSSDCTKLLFARFMVCSISVISFSMFPKAAALCFMGFVTISAIFLSIPLTACKTLS